VKGRIVLFDVPFDQELADRGLAGQAYGAGSNYRGNGPRMAAEMGAAAALVRSVGGANYRIAAHRREPAGRRAHSGGRRHGRGFDADGAPGRNAAR
jgi:hypothetical protein